MLAMAFSIYPLLGVLEVHELARQVLLVGGEVEVPVSAEVEEYGPPLACLPGFEREVYGSPYGCVTSAMPRRYKPSRCVLARPVLWIKCSNFGRS